jgi:hypothetical protein
MQGPTIPALKKRFHIDQYANPRGRLREIDG